MSYSNIKIVLFKIFYKIIHIISYNLCYIKKKYMKLIKSLSLNLFFFIIFFILADYSLGKIMPVYDPSGRMVYSIQNGVPLINKKNTVLRQWKNTGDYNVSITSNKYGLRNSKDFKNVSKNAYYVVGDSHTFGHGVEENERYSFLLENKYKLGEFVNIAIPTNVGGYYKLLEYSKKNGAKINNIIIGLTLENDLRDYADLKDKIKNKPNKRNYFAVLKQFLTETSSFYNLLTSVIHQSPDLKKIAIKLRLIKSAHGHINPFSTQKEIVSTINYIKKIKTDFNPVKFYVVMLPSRGLWFSSETEKYFEEHDLVREELIKNNIDIIDPIQLFIKLEDPKKLHFKYDGHFNKTGHSLIAGAIYEKLK